MRRRGFTLVELLVAIAIVVAVTSIVLPVYARAKGAALKAECLSNVRQITMASLMYMEENGGDIPIGRTWPFGSWLSLVGLESERGPVLKCPLHKTRFLAEPQNTRASGYVLNACMIRTMRPYWPAHESSTVLVAEKGTIYSWSAGRKRNRPSSFLGRTVCGTRPASSGKAVTYWIRHMVAVAILEAPTTGS